MRQSIHDGWTPQPEDEEAAYYEAHCVELERDEWQARAEDAEQKLREIGVFTLRTHASLEATKTELAEANSTVKHLNALLTATGNARDVAEADRARYARGVLTLEAENVRLHEQVATLRYTLNIVINDDGNHLTTSSINMALNAPVRRPPA